MKLTQYGVGKSLSVLKSHILWSQQQSVLNITTIYVAPFGYTRHAYLHALLLASLTVICAQ